MVSCLPPLRALSPPDFQKLTQLPSLVIRTDDDVEHWKSTRSYYDYDLFLSRLSESVVGISLPVSDTDTPSQPVSHTLTLLDTLERWIDDIPPLETPQRFGNLAFRTWGARLEERADALLDQLLPPDHRVLVPYIKPYFLTSFGSFTRMDYGTGHETSFALFLLCLTLTRFFEPTPEEERHLVLTVFVRYLRLCWKLQDVYRLEPAGSHGVWGLDDYCFLPYIFGSGQLRDQTAIPPSAILHLPLPATNLYFMAIMRIHDVKHGPFFEHSSQLYSIATGVPNWGKVNSGLFKMYKAEVLGKRVVVQHIPLGGLLEWERPASGLSLPVTSSAPQSSEARHPAKSVGYVPVRYPGGTPRVASPNGRGIWQTPAIQPLSTAWPRDPAALTEPITPPVNYVRNSSTRATLKRDNVGDESPLS